MPQIKIIYGPHHEIDFIHLRPVLDRALQQMRETTNNIHSIIEYTGPENNQFQRFKNIFQNQNDETVFTWIRTGTLRAIRHFTETGEPSINIGNSNYPCIFGLFPWHLNLMQSLAGCSIHLEEPSYNDWNRIRPYIDGGSFQGGVIQRNENFIDNLVDIELSFRNLIRRLINQNNEKSFIIIRGDMHRFYFDDIRNEFEDEYEIPDFLTYGDLYQRLT